MDMRIFNLLFFVCGIRILNNIGIDIDIKTKSVLPLFIQEKGGKKYNAIHLVAHIAMNKRINAVKNPISQNGFFGRDKQRPKNVDSSAAASIPSVWNQ